MHPIRVQLLADPGGSLIWTNPLRMRAPITAYETANCNAKLKNRPTALLSSRDYIIMAALRSRCGHYILVLYFVMAALCNRGAIIHTEP